MRGQLRCWLWFLLFRREFAKLLGRIRQFKWSKSGGFDISLDQALQEVRSEAAAAGVPVKKPGHRFVPGEGDLHAALMHAPNISILLSWNSVQRALGDLVRRAASGRESSMLYNFDVPIDFLVGMLSDDGIIDDSTADITIKLWDIRNRVAHQRDRPTKEEALDYYDLSHALIEKVGQIKPPTDTR